ncbi:MAG: hypothetical protein MUD00_03045 [Candidatus Pacebacteria bacterium]|nr:hypothetical protein [Candidatus Paceibacterota bacterium]
MATQRIVVEAVHNFHALNFFCDEFNSDQQVWRDIQHDFTPIVYSSPKIILASYDLIGKEITAEDLLLKAKALKIYAEVDLAHIAEVLYRQTDKNQKLLVKGDGKYNFFLG